MHLTQKQFADLSWKYNNKAGNYKDRERDRVEVLNELKLSARVNIPRRVLYKRDCIPAAAHGIINPGVTVAPNGEIKMILRLEPNASTWGGHFLQDKAVPHVVTLDQQLRPTSDLKPIVSGMPSPCRPEDWRLFSYNGEVFSNFTNYFYYNPGFPQKRVCCRTTLARLHPRRLGLLAELDAAPFGLRMNKEEKNWIFYDNANELVAVYSVDPFTLFFFDDLGQLIRKQSFDVPFRRLGNRYLANSTNAVRANLPGFGEVWVFFVHQFHEPKGKGTRNRTYFQHAVVCDLYSYKPIAWTPFPVLGGGIAGQGRHDGVLYTSAILARGGNLYAFTGEGDSHSVVYTIPLPALADAMEALIF